MRNAWIAAVSALIVLAGTGALAGGERPVVVELFTSQGCNSCPPADALLARLAQRKDVIAMSLPITYWDMLGWKDTLASEANTNRQKAYAAAMGRGGVYTPQIIVDGVSDVVGSREDDVEEAIDDASEAQDEAVQSLGDTQEEDGDALAVSTHMLVHRHDDAAARRALNVAVALSRMPASLRVAIAAAPGAVKRAKQNATVWLLRLRSSATVRIGAGENGGRTMTYRNVVSDIKDVGRWNGEALSFEVPRADAKTPPHDGIVVILQQGGYGRVIGAAYLGHADYYAQR